MIDGQSTWQGGKSDEFKVGIEASYKSCSPLLAFFFFLFTPPTSLFPTTLIAGSPPYATLVLWSLFAPMSIPRSMYDASIPDRNNR